MRRSSLLRDDYQLARPPKDGSTIIVPHLVMLAVYWDDSIRRWRLKHPLHLDTVNDGGFVKWKRPRHG
jgi:hypothetical protein